MDEKLINGEQPNSNAVPTATADFEKTNNAEETGSLGKFKDVDALLGAYNALQSEFTRKCQQLSQYEKEKNDNTQVPFFEKQDWQNSFDEFFKEHPKAKEYSKEIAEVMVSDNALSKSKAPLSNAYAKILEEKYGELVARNGDENAIISSLSTKAKQKVVEEYLKEYKDAPMLMTGRSGSVVGCSTAGVKTMAEAGEIAKKLFL